MNCDMMAFLMEISVGDLLCKSFVNVQMFKTVDV